MLDAVLFGELVAGMCALAALMLWFLKNMR